MGEDEKRRSELQNLYSSVRFRPAPLTPRTPPSRSVVRRLSVRLARALAHGARPQRESPLQGDLERDDDPAAGALERAEPAVDRVAERSRRLVEAADRKSVV